MPRHIKATIITLAFFIAFFATGSAYAAGTAAATGTVGSHEMAVASYPARIALLYPQAIGLFFILDLTDKVVCLPRRPAGIANNKLEAFYNTFAPSFSDVADTGQV
ncbi:MAG TPA: hypothetical protein PKC25_00240, partial [Candidatus Rifleibacterium sp.]|nr:hypothetical protein [Candidatus Rifleibacterium sp.]